MLDDFSLVFAALIISGVELTIQRKDIGCGMLYQWIRSVCDQIYCVIINDICCCKVHKDSLEIFAGLEALKGKYNILGGHFTSGVKLHTLAKIEPNRGVINTFPTTGNTSIKTKLLIPPNKRITDHVRQLQCAAGQLLVNVQ